MSCRWRWPVMQLVNWHMRTSFFTWARWGFAARPWLQSRKLAGQCCGAVRQRRLAGGTGNRRRKVGEVTPCGCPVGTAVEVYNLFSIRPCDENSCGLRRLNSGMWPRLLPGSHWPRRKCILRSGTTTSRCLSWRRPTGLWRDRPVFRARSGRRADLGGRHRRRCKTPRICGPSQPEPQPQSDAVFFS